MKEKNFLFVVVLCISMILIPGYLIRLVEMTANSNGLDWNYIWNGFWVMATVVTTVGYGDYYAYTFIGRMIIFVLCLLGPFLISLMNFSIS